MQAEISKAAARVRCLARSSLSPVGQGLAGPAQWSGYSRQLGHPLGFPSSMRLKHLRLCRSPRQKAKEKGCRLPGIQLHTLQMGPSAAWTLKVLLYHVLPSSWPLRSHALMLTALPCKSPSGAPCTGLSGAQTRSPWCMFMRQLICDIIAIVYSNLSGQAVHEASAW